MDLFRSFFGLRGGGSGRSENTPPGSRTGEGCDCDCGNEWEPYYEDDRHSEFPFFFGHGHGGSSIDGMFQHFHHQQMEFLQRQMEDMLKGFGTIKSDSFLPGDQTDVLDKPESPPKDWTRTWTFSLPGSRNDKEEPIDFMLKEHDRKQKSESLPMVPATPRESDIFGFSFRQPFSSFPWNPSNQDQRKDTDLDDKVSDANALDLIQKSDGSKRLEKQPPPTQGFFSGKSVTMTTVRGADGKMEQKKVVRDSSGREESTVTRFVDGQTHTVTTITGPKGLEQKQEDYKNLDENDIHKFEEKWKGLQPRQHPLPIQEPSARLDPRDMDIFAKFFRDPWK